MGNKRVNIIGSSNISYPLEIKIDKKEFYNLLKKVGRDIRHGIMCNTMCFDPSADCDCYWANILDKDIVKLNSIIEKKKIKPLEAMKLFFKK